MLPVFVKPASPSDSKNFLEWSKNQPGWDAFIAFQPGTMTLCAYNKSKIIAYLPVQTPFVYETLAPNPEASEMELATALKEFTQFLISQAHIKGVSEIMFLGTDMDTSDLATGHLFERLPYTVYRVRISDLSPNPVIDLKE